MITDYQGLFQANSLKINKNTDNLKIRNQQIVLQEIGLTKGTISSDCFYPLMNIWK